MAQMGRYCKAYPLNLLRGFPGWAENEQNFRKEKKQVDGKEVEVPRTVTDADYLYLQQNYTVTDGIFIDENVVFELATDQWVEYCNTVLKFEIPAWQKQQIDENPAQT